MFCISNKIASIPSRKISRYRIWKENTVARCIYTMASYRIKMRSVQIPRTIETKNSNIAFECLPVLHSLHSIMEVVGSLKLLPHMNMEENVPNLQTNTTSMLNANVINDVYFVWYIVEASQIYMFFQSFRRFHKSLALKFYEVILYRNIVVLSIFILSLISICLWSYEIQRYIEMLHFGTL